MGYEIFEWLYAVNTNPAAGAAFLGSQGDPWDAQEDMLADAFGGIVAIVLYLAHFRSAPRPELARAD